MGRPLRNVPRPRCPIPGHCGRRVLLAGTYGLPGHRRPRYRCVPELPGEATHTFIEPQPRQITDGAVCLKGPRTPRNYEFPIKEIAAALVAMGRGLTYKEAAARARTHANRFRQDRYSSHGQLVADWVELFAPVVFAKLGPSAWPTVDSLVLDHLPFRIPAVNASGKAIPAGIVAFDIMAAMGYENHRAKIWLLGASPTVLTGDWLAFLNRLPGDVERVVTDGHGGTIGGACRRWPTAVMWRSEWHISKAIQRLLAQDKVPETDPAWNLRDIYDSAADWTVYVALADTAAAPRLRRWVKWHDSDLATQIANRPNPVKDGTPLTTGGLEHLLEPIKVAVNPRKQAFTNRRRLDCLLMLMQLELNRQADELVYAKVISDWLSANQLPDKRPGTAPLLRRSVVDHGGSSLPSPQSVLARKQNRLIHRQ